MYDKDFKITYILRLCISTPLKKLQKKVIMLNIQWVNEIRETIHDEAKHVMKKRGVNFKIDSLLSKPFFKFLKSSQ